MQKANLSDTYKHNMISESNNWASHRVFNESVQTRQVIRSKTKPWKRRVKK